MDWTAIAVSTGFCAAMTYFFYRKRQTAAALNSAPAFTRWMRLRHGTFTVLWLLVAIYLFLAPDSTGMLLATWWTFLILGIVIEVVQFSRTFSPRLMESALQKEQDVA